MDMHDPPHPGQIIRDVCLEPLGLTVTAAAAWLGVSRQSLSELLNGRNGLSAEMAVRLQQAFGGSAETWLRTQLAHDLWHARQNLADAPIPRYPATGHGH